MKQLTTGSDNMITQQMRSNILLKHVNQQNF